MIKKCIICEKEFDCYDKGKTSWGGGRVVTSKRPAKSLTYSGKCSREYNHLNVRKQQEIKENQEENDKNL